MTARRSGGFPPWLWVPSLYFAESLPNCVINDTAGMMFNDFGMPPSQLGLVTGFMYFAFVVKPLWSPFVEMVKSKRWWVVLTEVLLASTFLGLALAALSPNWLFWTKVCLMAMGFASATQDISIDGFYMLSLKESQQAAYTGIRNTFYRAATICAKGGLPILAGHYSASLGVFRSWSNAMFVPGFFFLALAVYHLLVLPRPEADRPRSVPSGEFFKAYTESFTSFFTKPGVVQAIPFMLLFRLAEAQVVSMIAPFLTGKRESGGLGLTTEQLGVAYGTYGVCGIICGGIVAGLLVARDGVRRWYWPMIFIMHLPNLAFLYLAFTQDNAETIVRGCLFLEQFGYGFGFTVYTLYIMYLARGDQKTSHYAIATGFMAISIMVPKMISGYVQTALGFKSYFLYIAVCTIPSFLVAIHAWRDKPFLEYFEPKGDADPDA